MNCICNQAPVTRWISQFRTIAYHASQTRVSSAQALQESPGYTSTLEADTHADTCVAGTNCVPLNYTDRTCDVLPYSDVYQPVSNVPIVTAATGYTASTGLNYILVIPEALYMPNLQHSLFNPNQFRHFGTVVQDNPFALDPMKIETSDGSFTACLQSKVRRICNPFLILRCVRINHGILNRLICHRYQLLSRRRLNGVTSKPLATHTVMKPHYSIWMRSEDGSCLAHSIALRA